MRDAPRGPPRPAAAFGHLPRARSQGTWAGGQAPRRLLQQSVSTDTPVFMNAGATGADAAAPLPPSGAYPPPVQAQGKFGAGFLAGAATTAAAGKLLPEAQAAPAAYVVAVPPQPVVASTPTTLGGPLNIRTSTPVTLSTPISVKTPVKQVNTQGVLGAPGQAAHDALGGIVDLAGSLGSLVASILSTVAGGLGIGAAATNLPPPPRFPGLPALPGVRELPSLAGAAAKAAGSLLTPGGLPAAAEALAPLAPVVNALSSAPAAALAAALPLALPVKTPIVSLPAAG
ncbi:hypothetical protein Rsub_10024 [Raphidocelis subcapitata]|uniref:Uncharacterized protein n=1 Tax=Raphidocelis subcapitata TaxID=307507 RepID=A0A2V0PHE1_9CHLO|nr:hypothetical protein Rsub_10024 [Raphidocelis subcapitata]|eukprot:GBF97333.1 hypothetical protein Rsub_10024 [Raphidocelis subcapitata]